MAVQQVTDRLLSWWVGLDRAAFQREIAHRAEGWRRVKPNAADGVGARLRESWLYERRGLETRRTV